VTRRRRQFSPEFKEEAIRMVLEGDRTVASVAREFDISASALGSRALLTAQVGEIFTGTWEGFLYLATVTDCHGKAVLGWAMADHYRTELIKDAIRMACTAS
jgi:transposase InsO family protein